ncbi:MAG TPA: acetyl-coenzyme A synthetase N-terminal domain-containing protein, partial [Propionicimonas sp.]|uniref:acetyl-coenzyme A synthetase N-terminal domain-containing protein n=1 Tax=Propionicimonas sp. TaxID=1955623 RepID=UPI002F3F3938
MYNPDPSFGPEDTELRAAAIADPIGFWADRAAELEWYQPWDTVLDDSNPPFYKWFTGAKTNIVHNCIDRHLSGPYKNKLALIWVGENGTDYQTFSYF